MGNEVSKPEPPSGRSRSLSPLPRDDQDSELRQFPSTMPPSVATDDLRPRLSGSPEPLEWGARLVLARDARSPGLSPESLFARPRVVSPEEQPFHATQLARSAFRSESPVRPPRPSTQPESSNAKKPRSSKTRASDRQTKRKKTEAGRRRVDEVIHDGFANEDAANYEEIPMKQRNYPSGIASTDVGPAAHDQSPPRTPSRRPRSDGGTVRTENWECSSPIEVEQRPLMKEDIRNGKSRGSTESQPHSPAEDDIEVAVTPTASYVKSPGSRQSTRRKAKQPFFLREDEENAKAPLGLYHYDATVPARAARLKRAPQLTETEAEVEANPSSARQGLKKSRKRSVDDTVSEDLDDSVSARKSGYRSGVFSKTEEAHIVAAVDRYQEEEGMSRQEVNRVIHEDPRKTGDGRNRRLWASIQDACPSRPRRKLINWCRQRFHNFVGRGTWTKEQDDELVSLLQLHGKRWTVIAGLINRYPNDVRDRWRNYLVCRDTAKSDVWSEDEEVRLRALVETSMARIEGELGTAQNSKKSPEELVNWLKISEAMGYTRSRLQCMEKWKRLRAADPVPASVFPSGSSWRLQRARKDLRSLTTQDKYTLLCAIRDSGIGVDSKIPWQTIVHGPFHGKYERQALLVTWSRLRQTVPGWQLKTARDCSEYLCQMYETEGNFENQEDDEADNLEHDVPEGDANENKADGGKGKGREASSPFSTGPSIPVSQNAVVAKGNGEDVPRPESEKADTKGLKRMRRRALFNDHLKSTKSKRQKILERSTATKAKVDSSSSVSSDMDDMEDIPARLAVVS